MREADRLYFSKFAVDPEYETIFENADWQISERGREVNHLLDSIDFDELDEEFLKDKMRPLQGNYIGDEPRYKYRIFKAPDHLL